MIAWLEGKLIQKNDLQAIVNVQGVGYEVFCSARTIEVLSEAVTLHIYTHYKADGAALFGFLTQAEKDLFLNLIKVDSVGPKSALNILSAAPWEDIVDLIEAGDVGSLSRLPKISKKTAEHVVVKLKGKLGELLITSQASATAKPRVVGASAQMRKQAQTALTNLGYKTHEVERALDGLSSEAWLTDIQSVIRFALNDLSGSL